MGSHAGQNIEKYDLIETALFRQIYKINTEIPKKIFKPDYPDSPQTFGDLIRKTRIDAGLMINELADKFGVTEDTVINWEKHDIHPMSRNLKRIEAFLSEQSEAS